MGWFVDTLRLFWGLIYWNLRKTWFRLRRGRTPCPCQSSSDSGVEGEKVPFTDQTAGIRFSLFCAAGAVGDEFNLGRITGFIRQSIGQSFLVLGATEAFFRGDSNQRSILPFLPALLVPLEVTYALLERYADKETASRGISGR